MSVWEFIGHPDNQKTMAWLGGGFLVMVSGLWAAFLQLRKPSDPPPAAKPTNAINAGDGIAATGNVRVDGNVSVTKTQIPKAVYGLAALGLLVIGWAFIFAGDDICASGSVVVGGDIEGSDIKVDGQQSSVDC